MECSLRRGCERILTVRSRPSQPGRYRHQQQRWLATPAEIKEPIRAAPAITFNADNNQFARGKSSTSEPARRDGLLDRIRIVPASPSYFTATPQYTDDLLHLVSLLRQYSYIPKARRGQAPRIAWKTFDQYVSEVREPVRRSRFGRLLNVAKRLNEIHPPLVPADVTEALLKFKRTIQPFMRQARPVLIDEWGRTRAIGRRKTSHAQCFVVEGEGEVLVNGKSLTQYFGRIHDRENSVWALKATERLDKYNVFAVVKGGGTTGQAEAVMLGVARALLAHEPDLKPALRRAGCLKRDPRKVERKKPGKLKARKMPAWVKR